jgi:hypothetical protein
MDGLKFPLCHSVSKISVSPGCSKKMIDKLGCYALARARVLFYRERGPVEVMEPKE